MKPTRHLINILALVSFAFGFAGETEMSAKHHDVSASESTRMVEPKETMDCGKCVSCTGGVKKMISPKVRETGPVDAFPVSLLYIP